MDRYETSKKMDELRRCLNNHQYRRAYKVLQTVNLNKVKNVKDLYLAVDVCMGNERYELAKTILTVISRKVKGRRVVHQLIDVSIKCGMVEDAQKYMKQFAKMAPKDPYLDIFNYQIGQLKKRPIASQIKVLEQLKKKEYMEKWAYELAKLYCLNSNVEACIAECNELILWFGEGPYVEKAKLLSQYYQDKQSSGNKSADSEEDSESFLNHINEMIPEEGIKAYEDESEDDDEYEEDESDVEDDYEDEDYEDDEDYDNEEEDSEEIVSRISHISKGKSGFLRKKKKEEATDYQSAFAFIEQMEERERGMEESGQLEENKNIKELIEEREKQESIQQSKVQESLEDTRTTERLVLGETEQIEAEQVEAEQVEAEQVEAEQIEAQQVEAEQEQPEQEHTHIDHDGVEIDDQDQMLEASVNENSGMEAIAEVVKEDDCELRQDPETVEEEAVEPQITGQETMEQETTEPENVDKGIVEEKTVEEETAEEEIVEEENTEEETAEEVEQEEDKIDSEPEAKHSDFDPQKIFTPELLKETKVDSIANESTVRKLVDETALLMSIQVSDLLEEMQQKESLVSETEISEPVQESESQESTEESKMIHKEQTNSRESGEETRAEECAVAEVEEVDDAGQEEKEPFHFIRNLFGKKKKEAETTFEFGTWMETEQESAGIQVGELEQAEVKNDEAVESQEISGQDVLEDAEQVASDRENDRQSQEIIESEEIQEPADEGKLQDVVDEQEIRESEQEDQEPQQESKEPEQETQEARQQIDETKEEEDQEKKELERQEIRNKAIRRFQHLFSSYGVSAEKEPEKILGGFLSLEGVSDRVYASLESILSAHNKNTTMVLKGKDASDLTYLAKRLVKVLHVCGQVESQKLAIVQYERFLKICFEDKMDQLKGCTILVEGVDHFEDQLFQQIGYLNRNQCMVIIEEPETMSNQLLLEEYPQMARNLIEISTFTYEQLIRFVDEYVDSKGYLLTKEAKQQVRQLIVSQIEADESPLSNIMSKISSAYHCAKERNKVELRNIAALGNYKNVIFMNIEEQDFANEN